MKLAKDGTINTQNQFEQFPMCHPCLLLVQASNPLINPQKGQHVPVMTT